MSKKPAAGMDGIGEKDTAVLQPGTADRRRRARWVGGSECYGHCSMDYATNCEDDLCYGCAECRAIHEQSGDKWWDPQNRARPDLARGSRSTHTHAGASMLTLDLFDFRWLGGRRLP